MFRYLPGIVLIQVVTLALFWVNQGATTENLLLRAGLPAAIIACVTALWLSTLGRMDGERRNAELREKHANEREQLNREIERTRSEVLQQASADKAQIQERAHVERERLVKQTHKQLMQRERSISRRANFKVALAFMAVSGLGVLMLVTNMLTLGLLTITTAGGALGGYLLRWRQSRLALDRLSEALPDADSPGPRVVDQASVIDAENSNNRNKPIELSDRSTGVPQSRPQSSKRSR